MATEIAPASPTRTEASPYQLHDSPTRMFTPNNHNHNHDRRNHNYNDDDDDDDNHREMSLTELLYSSSSFHAICKPVSVTMILAALAVVRINDEASRLGGQEAMADAYNVWHTDGGQSGGQVLAITLANTLVMVSVICAMTFAIVLLYKMKCMTCLVGYMMLSSATLLGLLGGIMLQTAIRVYSLNVDKPTFFLAMFNFAVVGVMAVFWGKGIPTYVTQAYLIATSVILAWQLSHFDDVTAWCLLVMLALYDLCAVLTPCGPLKALVNLMSREDSPDMPGLLYEAELPVEAQRPGGPSRATRTRSDVQQRPWHEASMQGHDEASGIGDDRSSVPGPMPGQESVCDEHVVAAEGPLTIIPLAIALVYSLPIIQQPSNSNNNSNVSERTPVSASPLLEGVPSNPTAEQLRANVTVRLPASGGRIEQKGRGKVYLERDRFGAPKRTLWVDRQGKVFMETEHDDDGDDRKSSNSIRLGLGDFIFYSVLVGKAAQYSFATFAACMLVILSGLGGTLVLLSVYHHALPALPISIFLGVAFYLLTRILVEPWIEALLTTPFYV